MRALAAIFLLGACSDRDPCAGHDGTCVALHVAGSGSVDQLEVHLEGAASLDGRTPPVPDTPRPLPVTTALFLPSVDGIAHLTVAGWLAGADVGEANADVSLRAGGHTSVTVTLQLAGEADLLGRPDLELDLAVGDLGGDDLSSNDFAASDFSLSDMAQPDLAGLDLVGTAPRRVFVLPARPPNLGALSGLDQDCNLAATAQLLGGSYLALIAYPGVDLGATGDPADRFKRTPGRPILLPSGTRVAFDDTLFSGSLQHGIDQLADGTPVTGCAWSQFGYPGSRINSSTDCMAWSSLDSSLVGMYGDVTATDTSWAFSAFGACDVTQCHIYCIQSD